MRLRSFVAPAPRPRVLVARWDSLGDVLLTGPAVRALAAVADVDFLCSGLGQPAAELLPGVRRILRFDAPWVLRDAPAVDRRSADELVATLGEAGYAAAAVLTSSHQSPLPLALLLRFAGVPEIAAVSHDHAGRLLDHRIPGDPDVHEVERSLLVADALGAARPADVALRVRAPRAPAVVRDRVVVHPGCTAPARTLSPEAWREVVGVLLAQGWSVVVTGSAAESELCTFVAGGGGRTRGAGRVRSPRDVAVRTGAPLAKLARILGSAAVVATGNTGPMHLAAAMGRPVASIFAPTVPPERWAPWMVEHRLLGALDIACAGCRSVVCPLEAQACLAGVTADAVADAVAELALGQPSVPAPNVPMMEVMR